MTEIGDELCAEYEARGVTGRPVFWRRNQVQIHRDLQRFLTADDLNRREKRTRPIAVELGFGMSHSTVGAVPIALPDGRTLHFRGMADRVDVDEHGGLHVVDYKTGRDRYYAGLSEENPDDRGQRVQLPVYGIAARLHQQTPDARVLAEYWFVSYKGNFKRIGYEVTDAVLAHVRRDAGVDGRGHRSGRVRLASDGDELVAVRRMLELRPRRARRHRAAQRVGAQAPRPRTREVRASSPSRSTRNSSRTKSRSFRVPELADDAARDRIERDLTGTLFVEAGAGSGKTTALVARVVALVTSGVAELREIAAITFTEKAGAELRDRIRRKLQERATADPDPEVVQRCRTALDQLDGAAIGTLHSFAHRLLSEHPIEAGLPPRVEVLDEVSSGVEFERRWSAFRDDLLDDRDLERTLLLLLTTGVGPAALDALALAFEQNWDLVEERVPADAAGAAVGVRARRRRVRRDRRRVRGTRRLQDLRRQAVPAARRDRRLPRAAAGHRRRIRAARRAR